MQFLAGESLLYLVSLLALRRGEDLRLSSETESKIDIKIWTVDLESLDVADIDLEVELLPRDENDVISNYILELLETHKVLHWREIMRLVRERYTVSIERLQNILRNLVHEERVIELPCRFFTLSHILNGGIRKTDLIRIIEEKIRDLNLSRCSPPLASSKHPFRFRISRSSSKDKVTLVVTDDE